MKLISHRGNINGENIELENTPDYIDEAISLGYDVEIDIWKDEDGFYLGHDKPTYPINLEWLVERKNKLWIHCKDFDSLTELIRVDSDPLQLKIFYHQREEYTIISDNHIWAHNIETVDNKCIIPLLSRYDIENWIPTNVYGVCSDYIEFLKV
tara:strand:- start:71 stop:529 length:459 start_codon:yes stop_codon:yes gene_type:complete